MKVVVYGICGPGEEHVNRMIESAWEADEIHITKTTEEELELKGPHNLFEKLRIHYVRIEPFRFDDARNASLAVLPIDTEICVCVDMDEVLLPGWRLALEAAWLSSARKANSAWISFDPGDGKIFPTSNRVHARDGFRWRFPCHEGLYPNMTEVVAVAAKDCVMKHMPERGKRRLNYLRLLSVGAGENPESLRMIHYYGRELMFRGFYDEAITWLKEYLEREPSEPFPAERKATEYYITLCERAKADGALEVTAAEADHVRDCYRG